jgi:hypothetical protein
MYCGRLADAGIAQRPRKARDCGLRCGQLRLLDSDMRRYGISGPKAERAYEGDRARSGTIADFLFGVRLPYAIVLSIKFVLSIRDQPVNIDVNSKMSMTGRSARDGC